MTEQHTHQPRRPSAPWRRWLAPFGLVLALTGWSQGTAWWRDREAASVLQSHAQAGDIVMFTTSTCPYCAQAKAWFKAHDVAWQECNVDTSAACSAEFDAQGAPGVPLMRVRGQWQLGFTPQRVAQALKRS